MAVTPSKVIQGHQLQYQWKARMRLFISEWVKHSFWDIADFRCRLGWAGGCLQHMEWTAKFMTAKFSVKKLETSLYCMVQKVFWYLEPFKRDSRVWRTDRRTDFLIANAALQHVVRPAKPTKNYECEMNWAWLCVVLWLCTAWAITVASSRIWRSAFWTLWLPRQTRCAFPLITFHSSYLLSPLYLADDVTHCYRPTTTSIVLRRHVWGSKNSHKSERSLIHCCWRLDRICGTT